MASGHVNRANRPNTWLHRPRLQTCRFSLPTRSRPHMAQSRHSDTLNQCPLSGVKRTSVAPSPMSAFDPKRTLRSRRECVWYDSLMDGVHDMVGVDGFGKIEVEKNEPVFHAEWEGRILAMQRAMSYAGAWRIDHSRFAKEQLPPITYLSASYYPSAGFWEWRKTSSSAASRQPRNSKPAMPQLRVRCSEGSSRFRYCRTP